MIETPRLRLRPRCEGYGRTTAFTNVRSRGLMREPGITRRPGLDCRHPQSSVDDPRDAMVVYAIDRAA